MVTNVQTFQLAFIQQAEILNSTTMNKEYKVLVEDASPSSDLEGRLETRMNNLSIDDWKLAKIMQGNTTIIVVMERDSGAGEKDQN